MPITCPFCFHRRLAASALKQAEQYDATPCVAVPLRANAASYEAMAEAIGHCTCADPDTWKKLLAQR